MTILYVREKTSRSGGVDEGGKQPFSLEYTVMADSASESDVNVLTAAGIPAYGSLLSGTSAFCVKKHRTRDTQNPCISYVTCEFNTMTGNGEDPAEKQKSPDARRQKWSAKFSPIPWAFFGDLDGKAFTDTAGTPMDPPPQIPLYVDEWTCQVYTATCNRTTDRGFMNFTNTDSWNGCAANTALIADIDVQEVYEYGAYWFLKTYRFLVNPRYTVSQYGKDVSDASMTIVGGWNPFVVLNAGGRELQDKPGGGKQAVPIERNGLVDGRAHPLDKNGVAIVPAAGGSYGTNLVWLKFRAVGTVAFSTLTPTLTPPWST